MRIYLLNGYSPSCASPENADDISPALVILTIPHLDSISESFVLFLASQISPAVCRNPLFFLNILIISQLGKGFTRTLPNISESSSSLSVFGTREQNSPLDFLGN